ncbi:MAG: GFA family protein [Pseudomonadota bacterium]
MAASSQSAREAGGGCLCGAVRYALSGPLRPVVACHCGQCRRFHGHFGAYTQVARQGLRFLESRGLAWYQSSAWARRGFCSVCGSSLFWERLGGAAVSVAAGSLDQPTGLKTFHHIFVADQGDYYDIADGLPHSPGWPSR